MDHSSSGLLICRVSLHSVWLQMLVHKECLCRIRFVHLQIQKVGPSLFSSLDLRAYLTNSFVNCALNFMICYTKRTLAVNIIIVKLTVVDNLSQLVQWFVTHYLILKFKSFQQGVIFFKAAWSDFFLDILVLNNVSYKLIILDS